MKFVAETEIAASAAVVFGFHEAPDAFARLQPPWQRTEVLQPPTSLAVGTRVILRTKVGPLWQTIEAEHVAYEPGVMFADRMVRGPFARWLHRHVVTPRGPDRCVPRRRHRLRAAARRGRPVGRRTDRAPPARPPVRVPSPGHPRRLRGAGRTPRRRER
jgi:hypothetical protein